VSVPKSGVLMPSGGLLQNLLVKGVGLKSSEGAVLTVFVNGLSTDMTCTVDTSETCSDTVHTVSVKAGDIVAATYLPGASNELAMAVSLEKQ
jgi:hypothetical protein